MKKIIFFIFLLIGFNSVCYAECFQEKTTRELIFAGALFNDWRQTLHISETPSRKESNKLLGRRPHRDNVNIYFAGCLLGHALVAYTLPNNYAKIWQDVWIGIESNTSNNNVGKGHKEYASINYRLTHTITF